MSSFDLDRFMHNVRREAGGLEFFAAAGWADLPALLRLRGEDFVRAAYWFILHREADDAGLSQYIVRAQTGPGKLRIVLSLYFSPENGRAAAWKYTVGSWARRLRHQIAARTAPSVPRSSTASSGSTSQTAPESPPAPQRRDTDALYFAFENRFREDFDTIRARLHTRYAATLAQVQGLGPQALDLGCGRGEAVALFAEHGFQATGVDGNQVAVAFAAAKGLSVRHGDLFAHLAATPPDSQAVVSALHVIEHLPFERLRDLIDEAWRVLLPGGLLLLETPNARNLLVTGGDFYRDPTHLRPVFPDTLDFLLNGAGFAGQACFFDQQDQPVPAAGARLDEIQDYFHVSRDMVWIGRKTPQKKGWQ